MRKLSARVSFFRELPSSSELPHLELVERRRTRATGRALSGSVDVPMRAVGGKAGGKVPIAKVTVLAGFTPARLDLCKVRSKIFEMDHEIKETAHEVVAG